MPSEITYFQLITDCLPKHLRCAWHLVLQVEFKKASQQLCPKNLGKAQKIKWVQAQEEMLEAIYSYHKIEEPSRYNQPDKARILRGYIQWGVG